jgi:hypothetical protein
LDPVRPDLDVGGVIRCVFAIYVDQAAVLMPAAATVFVFTGILSTVLLSSGAAGLALISVLISLVATTLFTGMVVELVADVQDGRRDSDWRALLRAATPVIGQLILVGIAAAVGTLIGFILLVIPGLVLLTVWSVAAPVVVLERPPGFTALRRSRELVRGNGWRVFAVIIVLDVLVAVLSGGIEVAADSAGTGVGIVVRDHRRARRAVLGAGRRRAVLRPAQRLCGRRAGRRSDAVGARTRGRVRRDDSDRRVGAAARGGARGRLAAGGRGRGGAGGRCRGGGRVPGARRARARARAAGRR